MKAIVVGATGAVGSALVRELLGSDRFEQVTILIRRDTGEFDKLPGRGKLVQRRFELSEISLFARAGAAGCKAAFCTMGIGQPRKVSRAELWKVDVDGAVAFARGCRLSGVRHFSLLGAVGANAKSKTHYLRAKGVVEESLTELRFPRTSFFQPSLLVTTEVRYGLQDRITQAAFPLVSKLLPPRFRQIRVEDLARAMRLNAEGPSPPAPAVERLRYPEFQALLRGDREEQASSSR